MSGIFFQIHAGLPREGPGDDASTRRALAMVGSRPLRPRILDVGCGPGAQSIQLARESGGYVVGLDMHADYLDRLKAGAAGGRDRGRIDAVRGSMASMPFADRSFDMVWAEGSIYIVGFEQGLRDWKRLLRPNGWMAATHLSWLTDDVPTTPRDFWSEKYPAIASVADNLAIAVSCGYQPIGWFVLPESAWWNDYYGPLEKRLAALRRDPMLAEDDVAQAAIAGTQEEIDLYRRYAAVYGYAFYVLRLA